MNMLNGIKKTVNPKLYHLNKAVGQKPFRLLDVGAGNHSASKIKSVFPNCEYHGLDLDRSTNYSEQDFEMMQAFYELDLTKLDLSGIPDSYFDYINMAHVIEHLHNGDQVLPLLIRKLKPGGHFYIEYPGPKSTSLPSMHGTLNFHDDPTHVRLYRVAELKQIFEQNNCTVLRSGTRRNVWYILSTPLRIAGALIREGRLRGNLFWDLLGFAEYLFVRKKM